MHTWQWPTTDYTRVCMEVPCEGGKQPKLGARARAGVHFLSPANQAPKQTNTLAQKVSAHNHALISVQ